MRIRQSDQLFQYTVYIETPVTAMISMLPRPVVIRTLNKIIFATETYSSLFILAIPHESHYFMVALVYKFNKYLNTATYIHFTCMYHVFDVSPCGLPPVASHHDLYTYCSM